MSLGRPGGLDATDDEAVLVAEREGAVVGFAAGRVVAAEDDARWQILRELAAVDGDWQDGVGAGF